MKCNQTSDFVRGIKKTLEHPSLETITVAAILHALADPVRAAIVRELRGSTTGMSCVETSQRLGLEMPKSTCSQHYRVLREAGLIMCEREGVELRSRLRLRELNARFPGLLDSILKAYRRTTEA